MTTAGKATQKIGDQLAKKSESSEKDNGGVLGTIGKVFKAVDDISDSTHLVINPNLPSLPGMPAARVLVDMAFSVHMHFPPTPGNGLPPDLPLPPICVPHPVMGITTALMRKCFNLMFTGKPYNVFINGMPAAQCGDGGYNIRCCGASIYEIAVGSSSVNVEGDRAARCLDITAHCTPNPITKYGMPRPFQGPPTMPLPPVPFPGIGPAAPGIITKGSHNVFIGGFPLPSFKAIALGMMFKALFKAMGLAMKGLAKVGKMAMAKGKQAVRAAAKGGQKAKKAGDSIKRAGSTSGNKAKDMCNTDLCTKTGHPVDIATGKVICYGTDFALPGFIPLEFKRVYKSTSSYNGPVGFGWMHNLDMHITVVHNERDKFIVFRDHEGRDIDFDYIAIGQSTENSTDKLTLKRLSDNQQELFFIQSNEYQMLFKKLIGRRNIFSLVEIQDPYYNTIKLEYDPQLKLSKIRDSADRILLFEYYDTYISSKNKNINSRSTDQSNGMKLKHIKLLHRDETNTHHTTRLVSFLYDNCSNDVNKHLLVGVVDQLGNRTSYEYVNDLLVRETDKNGYSYHFQYDENGYCVKTWGDGGTYSRVLRYDLKDKKTTEIRSQGEEIVYQYNDFGLVERQNDSSGMTATEWDENMNKISFSDQLGNTTRWGYDSSNTEASYRRDAKGNTERYQYDENGQLTKYTDRLNNIWEISYDSKSNRTIYTDPLGRKTQYKFNAKGKVESIVEPGGMKVELKYDNFGNLTEVVDSSNNMKIVYGYDSFGNIVEETDSLNNKVKYTYNLSNRIINEETKEGSTKCYEYDRMGNVIQFIDSNGAVTKYEYNGLGALVRTTTGMGGHITYSYGSESELKSVTNANQETTYYFYDMGGKVTKGVYFDEKREIEHRYDSVGRFLKKVTGTGNEVEFNYDENGNISKSKASDGNIFTYAYDRLDRLVTVNNGQLEYRFEYDAIGRMVRESSDYIEIKYEYDDADNLIRLSTSKGRVIKYHYDKLSNNLIRIVDSSCGVHEFSYDLFGRKVKQRFPNGLETRFGYDCFNRMVGFKIIDKRKNIILRRKFEYDVGHKVVRISGNAGSDKFYKYDDLERLTLVTGSDVKCVMEHYRYDVNGNIVKNNRFKSIQYDKGGRVRSADRTLYRYDLDGNMVEKIDNNNGQISRFEYDSRGNLKDFVGKDGNLYEYEYDYLGRRTSKIRFGRRLQFIYSGDILIGEKEGDHSTDYLFLHKGFVPIAANKDGKMYFYHVNHLNVPEHVSNESGVIIWSLPERTDSFGSCDQKEDAWNSDRICPFGFPGQYFDEESGLYYNRFRYYDPDLGRYICQDPLGLIGGINLYEYSRNPVNWIDPYGLQSCKVTTAPELRRQAMDELGIPRSQQPVRQIPLIGMRGRRYIYEVPTPRGGSRSVEITTRPTSGGIPSLPLRPKKAKAKPMEQLPSHGSDYGVKAGGEIPDHIPPNWSREHLEEAKNILEKSLETRRREMAALTDDTLSGPAHRERIRKERNLLEQINKRLRDSYPSPRGEPPHYPGAPPGTPPPRTQPPGTPPPRPQPNIPLTPTEARERASRRGREILEKLKEEGVGTQAGRSGGHGTPHRRAGAELVREANKLPKDDPMREALKAEGERLRQQGKGHSHR